jgi:MoxR-like ATPase
MRARRGAERPEDVPTTLGTPMQAEETRDARDPREIASAMFEAVSSVVRGKPESVALAIVALLSGGHLLVEDSPGTGKTLLARALAASIDGRFRRVQCTPDLLPADVTGTTVFNPVTGEWDFRGGPVFAHVLLVDELNRASPRTQAALLEPMEERQVTIDGVTHDLPDPFFCIATQNPFGQAGTFPLPESQLDRFAVVIGLGLPGRAAEREILSGAGGVDALVALDPVVTVAEVARAIDAVRLVHCAGSVEEFVLDVAQATRDDSDLVLGASPRAALGLLQAARAHATLAGRDFVSPDDVKNVAPAALAHRLLPIGGPDVARGRAAVERALQHVEVPRA